MFRTITPEEAGISSRAIARYIDMLERRGLTTHGILMMKGNDIFAEYYWDPYTKDSCHRMYSQTKSYVSMAIGLLEADGKLSLDDCIADYFPERIDRELPEDLRTLTIRNMLTMTTTGGSDNWFLSDDPDRTHHYFAGHKLSHPAGSLWEYDSPGSQVMGSLVEKLTGKPLLDFLRERVFDTMGTFSTAEILKIGNGNSWADSALCCTLRDMASAGRLLLQNGCWEGKQLLPADYIKAATAAQVDNHGSGEEHIFTHGYGYQIWRTEQNGFAFYGMGDQITVMLPDHDLLFAVMSDNQGYKPSTHLLLGGFFDFIVAEMQEQPLPADPEALAALQARIASLKLRSLQGPADSPLRGQIDGKRYTCDENPMGIEEFTFVFTAADEGELRYRNAQGDKVLKFGINKNVFDHFPQYGYSDGVGGARTTNGFLYRDAVSMCWADQSRLRLRIQIIDRYFGNCDAQFAFVGDRVAARFIKKAEDFLDEYEGVMTGRLA